MFGEYLGLIGKNGVSVHIGDNVTNQTANVSVAPTERFDPERHAEQMRRLGLTG